MVPKISIVTVCYNNLKGLLLTAKSIEQQTLKDFEWIVIDGQSSDGTLEYLKNHKNNKLRYISEPDSGIYDAMNKGISLSKGEYLLFLNSGDYLYNEEVLYKVSNELEGDLIIGKLLTIYTNEVNKNPKLKDFSTQDVRKKYIYFKTLPHPSSFFSREIFSTVGFYDTNYKICGDYDLYTRIINNEKSIKFIQHCISVFSTDGISSSAEFEKLRLEENLKVQKKNFSLIYILFRSFVGYFEKKFQIFN